MSSIPPTANWIIRYTGVGNPSFTTLNSYYPNLSFESTSGLWNPSIGASRFQGISGTATILGNLEIGGSGAGTVIIYNENTAGSPIQINGNCTVRSGSTLTNRGSANGTGFQIKGHLQVEGFFDSSGGTGKLVLNGNSLQQISGSGSLSIGVLEINNTNGISLLRSLEVSGLLDLLLGKVTLNAFDLTASGLLSGGSTNSYVQTNSTGGLILPGSSSAFFPVGNNTYNPAILNYGGSNDLKVRVQDQVLSSGTSGTPVVSQMVNRTWLVDGGGSNSLSLTLQWNSGDEWPGFDRSQCYISSYAAGWNAGSPAGTSGGNPYSQTRTGLTGGNIFAVASGGVLPVELRYFRAQKETAQVRLLWQTDTETFNERFEVERSTDGLKFNSIGSLAGAGTTLEPQSYELTDPNPNPGLNYYRLKQIDLDGTFSFSDVEVVNWRGGDREVKIYPTVSTGQITLELAKLVEKPRSVMIFDLAGRLCREVELPAFSKVMVLDVEGLATGTYLISIDGNRAGRFFLTH